MQSAVECVCCQEIDTVTTRMEESEHDIQCITQHEGFEPVCLDVWVLQTAHFTYHQQYGGVQEPVHV